MIIFSESHKYQQHDHPYHPGQPEIHQTIHHHHSIIEHNPQEQIPPVKRKYVVQHTIYAYCTVKILN